MKRILLWLSLSPSLIMAQNVGIGTNTPQSTLDIKGNQRLGGLNNFLTYDSSTGRFTWTNSFLWVTNPQYIVRHSASSEGLYYASQQLEYRGSGGITAFSTNWNTGQAYVRGNLAVGLTSPSAKLHVVADAGDAIRIEAPSPSLTLYNSGVHTAYLKSHPFGIDLGSPAGWVAPIRLTPGDVDRFSVWPDGKVRIEGPSITGGTSLSLGGNGEVQVDAPGIVGGRFWILENGNTGIGLYPFEKLSVGGNVTAHRYKISPEKTYYYSVDPSAFMSRNSAVIMRENGGAYLESSPTYTEMSAPVNLPQGAWVTKITANIWDVSAIDNIIIFLCRTNADGTIAYQSNTIVSSGNGGTYQLQATVPYGQIDNSTYSYFLRAYTTIPWPGNSIKIRSVILEYTLAEL